MRFDKYIGLFYYWLDFMREFETRALSFSMRNLKRAILESPVGGPFPRLGRMGSGNTVETFSLRGIRRAELPLKGDEPFPAPGSVVVVYSEWSGEE